jgi:nucleotide-binding universal stress UspA family protein
MNVLTAVLAAGWLLEALILGVLMRRRGFDPYVWTLLGLFLGPIALFLAVSRIVSPPAADVHHVAAGHPGSGSLNVLIGVDGSPEAAAAVGRLKSLVGRPTHRITLARVAALDAPKDEEQQAVDELNKLSGAHPELDAETVVLHGTPTETLQSYAKQEGYDLIVVGSRGTGRKTALTGSVSSKLARGSSVPVLVVDEPS